MNGHRSRGFSLIELVLALSIASILLRISVPVATGFLLKARATSIVGDFNTVRAAAYAYFADHGDWPPEAGAGVVPAGLAAYLPKDFTFAKPRYQLDWENGSGSPALGYTGVLVGVSVCTPDRDLGGMTVKLMDHASAYWTLDDRWTLVLQSTLDPS